MVEVFGTPQLQHLPDLTIMFPTARKLIAFLSTPVARKHFHDSGVE